MVTVGEVIFLGSEGRREKYIFHNKKVIFFFFSKGDLSLSSSWIWRPFLEEAITQSDFLPKKYT